MVIYNLCQKFLLQPRCDLCHAGNATWLTTYFWAVLYIRALSSVVSGDLLLPLGDHEIHTGHLGSQRFKVSGLSFHSHVLLWNLVWLKRTNLKGTTTGCTWVVIRLAALRDLTNNTCPISIAMITSLQDEKEMQANYTWTINATKLTFTVTKTWLFPSWAEHKWSKPTIQQNWSTHVLHVYTSKEHRGQFPKCNNSCGISHVDHPTVHHTWVSVYHVNLWLHAICN